MGEPESKSFNIRKILNLINEHEWSLYLPSFQRSFLWDEEDIKKFLESMLNGYPAGSILLWHPSNKGIDPFARKFIDTRPEPDHSEVYYILDGQQRLTALMLLANGWKLERGRKTISRSPISYNPSKQGGELIKGMKRGIDLSRGIKDRLGDVKESLRLKRELGSNYNDFIRAIDKILNYEMPIYVVKTFNETPNILGKMANIFIMVNRAGQRITNVELLLSYAAGVFDQEIVNNLRNYYDEIQEKYGEEISIQPFLRFAFSTPLVGLKQQDIENVERFKASVNKIKGQLTLDRKKMLNEKIQNASKSFGIALDLVLEIFGKAAIELLPSHISLIPIACYLHINDISSVKELNENEKALIKKWLLLVNFNGYYSTRPSVKLQKDIETLDQSGRFPFREFLENIKGNKPSAIRISKDSIVEGCNKDILRKPNLSYLFLLYVALVDNEANDLTGRLIRNLNFEELARHHIFPRDKLKKEFNIPEEISEEDYPIKGINGLGNITLVHTDANSEISDEEPKEYFNRYRREDLTKHFIPINDDKLWDLKKFDDFVEKRIEKIYDFLKERYQDIIE
ncbi:MAG: DUF262 domain-containing protein [Thaumarchaeota archaeon]|nr:DUF262 domain-containing protein [Nitrososphaerota archaeon]